MNRAALATIACAVLFGLGHRQALATVEFCPATLAIRPVGAHVANDAPGHVFGFQLSAYGPRTVLAELAFDTDKGWFTADPDAVDLGEKDRRYEGSFAFVRREWTSPVMYVRFPIDVVISHAWVHTALSRGDAFGWSNEGIVECAPAGAPWTAPAAPKGPPVSTATNADDLSAAPGAGSTIILARASAPLESTHCAQPFADATVTMQAQPNFPDSARPLRLPPWTSDVTVAIRADGTLADAWISAPSGSQALDDAALAAARKSAYKNAIGYCQAVPAMYLFRVTFDSGV